VVLVDRKYIRYICGAGACGQKAGIFFHDPDDCYFAALYLNITFLPSSVQNDVQQGFKHPKRSHLVGKSLEP
jgi:hypothetical protein